ncbi:MAG: hypothetical protein ACO1O4_07220 [Devosia sp.]
MSMLAQQDKTLRVYGSTGTLSVKDFWFASRKTGGVGTIDLIQGDKTSQIEVREDRWLYTFEIDDVARSLAAGRLEFEAPGMSWGASLGNMGVFDAWREGAGLTYAVESNERADF